MTNMSEIGLGQGSPGPGGDPASGGLRTGIWGLVRNSANHPNGLTVIRIAMIPAIILLFSFPSSRFMVFLAALVFSAAAFTDYLDGLMARRQGKVTFMGKALDPVADKLLTSSAFIMLAAHGWVPAWMVCLLVGRELGITGLRSVIAGKGVDISSSRLGKLKTGFQIAAIIPLMIHYPLLDIDFRAIGLVLIWIALGFTVWSGIDYVIKFKRVM
jgi:CDP-diacylglycerol--glycerol-3-phosphate 3-phosphatidyltransferase